MNQEPMQNFKNRTVWIGDNLDVMRGINSNSIDLIYLDPPFNSKKTYSAPIGSQAAGAAFKDTWSFSDIDDAWLGLIADDHPEIFEFIEASGIVHGKSMKSYLCMMTVRLFEMKRILKDSGSLYLHCDDNAVHYLKVLMDAVWSHTIYRNTLVWQRMKGNKGSSKAFPRSADHILLYMLPGASFTRQYLPLEGGGLVNYRHRDSDGRIWRRDNLTGPGQSDGESGESWRGWNPSDIGRHWSVPYSGSYAKWIEETLIPNYRKISGVQQRLDALDYAGLITFSDTGIPGLKRYLDQSRGSTVSDVWTDIDVVKVSSKEGTGYPTQKPRKLLERIIEASSNKGDIVLDPFCGCATTMVAAERLERQWIGIDLSPLAGQLVRQRLQGPEYGALFEHQWVHIRNDTPVRSDIGQPINYRKQKHVLFGRQEGLCGGCGHDFPFRMFEVDHIVPQSKGGTDHPDNLQMLCTPCNRIKGNRTQAYLKARLKELGYVEA